MIDGAPYYFSDKQRPLAAAIIRILGRGLLEASLGELHSRLRSAHGELTPRTVNRYLDRMVRHGDVVRDGVRGHYVYRRARQDRPGDR